MNLYNWETIPEEKLNPLVTRQAIHGETMTVARLRMRKGSKVPMHSHHNEQITTVEQGALRFLMDGKEIVVRAGESLQIPPNVAHAVETLEDSVAVDIFSPIREDWIRGDDAYLRGG